MDYDESLHRTYVKGRRLSAETVDLWMDAIAAHLRSSANLTILDLGSGVGRFSVPLAERFGASVVGVEPSAKMRQQAQANCAHPRVRYVAGAAEHIPTASRAFDAAFLSMVVHHFQSLPDACRELSRVVRPGGRVFVRNSFKGRLDSFRFYEFFPSAKAVDEARLPSMEVLTSACRAAGLDCVAHQTVLQEDDDSLRSHCERIKLRALSTLELISDEEFDEGVRAMELAAQAETEPQPVMAPIDLLVFVTKPRVTAPRRS